MAGRGVSVFHHRAFGPDALAAAKQAVGARVSVCLPARDEEATVGTIVERVRVELSERVALVDEIVVVDDGSVDATARAAADAGAVVVPVPGAGSADGHGRGKGDALWRSLHVATGDLLAFLDADVRDFDARFVTGLLGPLLTDAGLGFVKGFYERPLDGVAGEGGRVTELVARPLVSLLFPPLTAFTQPLAGEFAARRSVLEQVPFARGYGVDLGLLVDVWRRFGIDAMAQVDLGVRRHRNRPLQELGPQAVAVLHAALARAPAAPHLTTPVVFTAPGRPPVEVDVGDRPPIATSR